MEPRLPKSVASRVFNSMLDREVVMLGIQAFRSEFHPHRPCHVAVDMLNLPDGQYLDTLQVHEYTRTYMSMNSEAFEEKRQGDQKMAL